MTNERRSHPRQARYWIATIPELSWSPPQEIGEDFEYIGGQLEEAPTTGYRHWQVVFCFARKKSLRQLKDLICNDGHFEPSRSDAVRDYVMKDDTYVDGTRFRLGEYPSRRNNKADWKKILEIAKQGIIEEIDADVVIRYYTTLKRISIDYGSPVARGPQEVNLYWGPTGSGKSKTVFDAVEGKNYYLKAPTTKWWDGYRGQEIVVIDEFRGLIEISHLLKWLDRYPCAVEVKGCQVFLNTKIWYFTSNLSLDEWYKDLDRETVAALRRRFTNIVFKHIINFPYD